ncbi:MAG: twin-arginine translocation signal domain-containing protein [Betaproteobacteria bacterium]|nr:twin-arginine translocation signal domain-containing protein [Betaproteobacteria bacterium]
MPERDPPEYDPASHPPAEAPPRREFLKASAAAAGAAFLSSCFGGNGGDEAAPLPGAPEVDPLSRIDHVVVVMFENRSFDNVLGYLYSQGPAPADWPAVLPVPPAVPRSQSFEGLFGKSLDNQHASKKYAAHPHAFDPAAVPQKASDWSHPDPNPGEGFENAKEQIAGGAMSGFVANYAKKKPSGSELDAIMGSYAPAQLTVMAGLAQGFAVFDHWFGAVPSETYCNRSFFHASTSSGYADNQPADKWKNNTARTIFDLLAERTPRVDWKVYFEKPTSASEQTEYPHGLTGLVHPAVSGKYPERFVAFEDFFTDVKGGKLPPYSFLERLYGGSYDYHPPQDVRNGEEVLRTVYEAIRTSGTTGARDYTHNTLLLVVFDEHGGTYDHVAPGPAPAPPAAASPSELGFDFRTLGPRVPAIAISAYTQAGTVVNAPMHHAAVIRTLCRKYGLPALNARDADPNGGDLAFALNLAAPRPAAAWPAYPASVSPAAG